MSLSKHIRYLKINMFNVKLINASKLFLKNLKNISDPEKKKERLLEKHLLKYLKKKQKKLKRSSFLPRERFIQI